MVHAMIVNKGSRIHVQCHLFLTSALDGWKFSASRPSYLIPRNESPKPLYRKLVINKAELDVLERRKYLSSVRNRNMDL
jgi:hypothetical protein